MESNEMFNSLAFAFIVIYATCSTALLGIPASMSYFVTQDAWIIPIIGSLIGLPIIFLYTILARWMPKGIIYTMNDAILGKLFGKLATIVYILFPLLHFPAIFAYGINFITHFLLPETPFIACMLLCLTVIVFGVFTGVEAIARTALLISIFFISPLALLIGLNIPDIDLQFTQPMFHSSLADSGQALSLYMGNVVCNVVIQLAIFPKYIKNKKTGERALWVGYSLGCFILILLTFLCITVLSPEVTARDFYPALSLAQRIELGEFLERIEATITILWFISIYFNLLLYFYAIVSGIAHLFNLKNSKPLILPTAMLLLFLGATYFTSVVQEREFYRFVSIPQSILTGLGLPLLLVLVGMIRRKRKGLAVYPKLMESDSTNNKETGQSSNV
ncbi:GerAB/ArcD/ProY family transporter [Shouchella patagoniensis]|uniref:GerAB/ArcD/ProY family transporter n=1 Tax=Shouchella patagoniensis TaxID=228576 RepID=UPI000995CE99|nr:endospore germination permease [Shouchella patagoniensis]